ncbi:hypothetical protein [Actinomadura sp. SCN-SB]|uniref:hypothetical protein n=1 Tax=Actinomadura sp. SCN-SB TaxID=3373092 RepID=UPI003750C716
MSASAEPGSLVGADLDYVPSDPVFGRPYIDQDVSKEEPAPHRYVHGGFEGTDTRFSFYFPPAERYQGRLLQYLEGGAGGHETVLTSMVLGSPWIFEFAYSELGAFLVESNQGHLPLDGTGFRNDTELFGASAESARFGSWLAGRLYGEPPHHRYITGVSGGGHRSFQCLMRAPDVYDGGVPEVFGVQPGNYWAAMGLAVLLLGEDLPKVVDACEPGGGDPFADLGFAQREALRDLFWMGYPRGALTQLARLPVFPFTLYNAIDSNPGYFRAFWNDRGYLGADQPERLASHVVKTTAKVRSLSTAQELSSDILVALQLSTGGAMPQTRYGAVLEFDEPGRLFMARLTVRSGAAAGREMVVADVVHGNVLVPFGERCPELFEGIEPGDEIEIDNSDWVAFCHSHLHSAEFNVPGLHDHGERVPAEYARFAVDGVPVFPQTDTFEYKLNEIVPFGSKMIMVGATHDAFIWPTKITPFARYVRNVLGDAAADTYRLWWAENCTHGVPEMGAMFTQDRDPKLWRSRLVDYEGVTAQALRDVVAWAEHGKPPPPDTAYTVTTDNRLVLPAAAHDRGGVQPVARLTVGGGDRLEVASGEQVEFTAEAAVPDGGGTIVEAVIDPKGTGDWPVRAEGVDGTATTFTFAAQHVYDTPGTYFAAFRVASHPHGLSGTGPTIQNLARVRVTVT